MLWKPRFHLIFFPFTRATGSKNCKHWERVIIWAHFSKPLSCFISFHSIGFPLFRIKGMSSIVYINLNIVLGSVLKLRHADFGISRPSPHSPCITFFAWRYFFLVLVVKNHWSPPPPKRDVLFECCLLHNCRFCVARMPWGEL